MNGFYHVIYMVILKILAKIVLFTGKDDAHGYLSFFP